MQEIHETISKTDESVIEPEWGPPATWVNKTVDEIYGLDNSELETLQLKWIAYRLSSFRNSIPALKTLVEKQGIGELNELNDAAATLFTHKVYKSYPTNLIEKNKYGLLTQWLDRLTTHDLTGIDMKGVKSIDDWMQRLDDNGMFMFHSTGTTGKLSFIPKSETEKVSWVNAFYKYVEALTGDEDIRNVRMPVFFPAYRTGRHVGTRFLEHFGPILAGSEDEYHALFNYHMSADFISLAGRLRHAQATGNLSKLDMIKALVKSKGELLKMKKKRPAMMEEFFMNMVENYRGQRVFVMAPVTDLLTVAIAAKEQGHDQVFDENAVLLTGGGLKGFDAPENWPELLKEVYGVNRLYVGYGMTEQISFNPQCINEHYHLFPWNVPFILDIDSGEPLPRNGVQTGRAGFIDLLAETYWGGLLTGDKVTIHYDECGCGWKGPWLEDNVQRYSELQEDGEDKISCSGSQEAYNQFLDFVLEELE